MRLVGGHHVQERRAAGPLRLLPERAGAEVFLRSRGGVRTPPRITKLEKKISGQGTTVGLAGTPRSKTLLEKNDALKGGKQNCIFPPTGRGFCVVSTKMEKWAHRCGDKETRGRWCMDTAARPLLKNPGCPLASCSQKVTC